MFDPTTKRSVDSSGSKLFTKVALTQPPIFIDADIAAEIARRLTPATRHLGLEKVLVRLNRLDRETMTFERILHVPGVPGGLSHDYVFWLHAGSDGRLWVSTIGGGLNVRDPETGRFSVYRHDPDDPNANALLRDVAEMRARMERDRPPTGPWDLKNIRGGLVDIEFIVQYLQLRHGPEFAENHQTFFAANTTDALNNLNHAGILDTETAETLIDAMRLWRNVQGVVRLSVGEAFGDKNLPDGCQMFVADVCGFQSFDELCVAIANSANRCHEIFRRLIEEPAAKLPPAD